MDTLLSGPLDQWRPLLRSLPSPLLPAMHSPHPLTLMRLWLASAGEEVLPADEAALDLHNATGAVLG